MSFGPESNNPRERRAYAHTILAKARTSGSVEDFEAAEKAVQSAGTSRKALASNFDRQLAGVAKLDEATRVIIEKADATLDPAKTPRKKLTWVGTADSPKDLVSARRYSQSFSIVKSVGASMGRTEVLTHGTGEIVNFDQLTATDLQGDRLPHVIPTDRQGRVSVRGVRTLPDAKRTTLAGIVKKIG
jgi:hypothetical protein